VDARWHVAQVNVALLNAPLDAPATRSFVELLDPINALADGSPGFVWRLQTGDGDATSIRVFDDDLIIVNLSVWETIDDLRAYVFASDHGGVLRRRRDWFAKMPAAHLAIWWTPVGSLPTVVDAARRLELVRERGASLDAFTFREPFPPPARPVVRPAHA
jgi:hypothetical protein